MGTLTNVHADLAITFSDMSVNVHQVHEAPGAHRQVSEGVSTAFPKLLPFTACGGKQRNALRGMNLVLYDVLRSWLPYECPAVAAGYFLSVLPWRSPSVGTSCLPGMSTGNISGR